MHTSELTEAERARFDVAMSAISEMPHEAQLALVEAAVAAAIRHDADPASADLNAWARGLLATIRLSGSKAYLAPIDGHHARPTVLWGR
jgi:hypothetical protein